jgi:hypothetical protein
MHTESDRSSRLRILVALASVALGACVNPFAVDRTPIIDDGEGGAGAGGKRATGTGGKGTGGSVTTGTGGSATGTGGSQGGGPDAGSTDGPVVVEEPEPVQPMEPYPGTIPQCPADIVDEEDPTVTCPRDLAEIDGWLPETPAMEPGGGCLPLPHPAGECQFYQQSFQEFMIATQPNAQGRPAFLGWNTIENTFGAGRGQPTPAIPVLTAGVTQAGGRQVVIDQNGHALYYAIHMNPAFVKFVNDAHLTSADQIKKADPSIHFTTTGAVVETKEAWMIIPDANPPQAATFITTRAMVPTLRVDPTLGVVADDANLRQVTVALIAIHIVHTIPGHPEFVWSTFQHVNRQTGVTDLAPSSIDLPRNNPPNAAASITPQLPAGQAYLLYARNTLPAASNVGVFVPALNPVTQTFTTPPTSIFRVFPAAKTATTDVDGDITALNTAMQDRFNGPVTAARPAPAANDRRPWYRLVGAVWLDRPARSFFVNKVLVNNPLDPDIVENGSDAITSINGGEDGLSSVAMESFTQGPASFPTCFSCHDTQSTAGNGVPQARNMASAVVMQPGLINVSHIFNEVVRLDIN